jgi:hypothetical protein
VTPIATDGELIDVGERGLNDSPERSEYFGSGVSRVPAFALPSLCKLSANLAKLFKALG